MSGKKKDTMATDEGKAAVGDYGNKGKTSGSQDAQPSPLALLAATCSKIGGVEGQGSGQQQFIIDPNQGLVQLQQHPQQLELVPAQLAGSGRQIVAASPSLSKENVVLSGAVSTESNKTNSKEGTPNKKVKTAGLNSAPAAHQFQIFQVQNIPNPTSSIQYQVIPHIQTADGQQIQINAAGTAAVQPEQIQLIQAGNNQVILASPNRSSGANIVAQNVGHPAVPLQIRPGMSFPLQLQAIQGAQTQMVTTLPINIGGVTVALPVINAVTTRGGSVPLVQPADGGVSNGAQLVSTPISSAASTCTTATASNDALVASSSDGANINSALSISGSAVQKVQSADADGSSQVQTNGIPAAHDQTGPIQQLQIVGQPVLQQIQVHAPQQQLVQGLQPQAIQLQPAQTIQALPQLQAPAQLLIRAPALTASGQLSWQTV